MALYLGILIFSFIITGLAIIPFIDFLFQLHLTYRNPIPPSTSMEKKEFSVIHQQQGWKIGTPIGGGILLITMVTLLYAVLFPLLSRFGVYVTTGFPLKEELNILFFTFISFGILGLYDDIIKTFHLPPHRVYLGPFSIKNLLQIVLATLTALMLYFNLNINIINFPLFGVLHLGWLFIPLASGLILAFTRGFDITDGLDGLASGVLLICLLAFWAVSVSSLDTVISVFIALWIGALVAFIYFNVYPARIWLGNAGSLSFGATLAVVGLLLGKTVALIIIGGLFILEAAVNLIQILAVNLFHHKVFPVTPLHYLLQRLGWPEPKIVMRLWLVAVLFAVIGLWLASA
jgi:phospho-N-acetylmuramoyl-pentapeptide-transferase